MAVVETVVHGLAETEPCLAEAALGLGPAGLVGPFPLLLYLLLDNGFLVVPGTQHRDPLSHQEQVQEPLVTAGTIQRPLAYY